MTALKIKGLQIKKVTSSEVSVMGRVVNSLNNTTEIVNNNGLKGLVGLIQQFVSVGGDFV